MQSARAALGMAMISCFLATHSLGPLSMSGRFSKAQVSTPLHASDPMSFVVVLPSLSYASSWYNDLAALHVICGRDCLETYKIQCTSHTGPFTTRI